MPESERRPEASENVYRVLSRPRDNKRQGEGVGSRRIARMIDRKISEPRSWRDRRRERARDLASRALESRPKKVLIKTLGRRKCHATFRHPAAFRGTLERDLEAARLRAGCRAGGSGFHSAGLEGIFQGLNEECSPANGGSRANFFKEGNLCA